MLLGSRQLEQSLAAAPVVSALVGSCPRLTVLVTSRAPVAARGEHQFPVPPLPLPEAEDLASGDVVEHDSPAVGLFCQRAPAVIPTFELPPRTPSPGTDLREVGGLPLAIELAAARVKLFPRRCCLPSWIVDCS